MTIREYGITTIRRRRARRVRALLLFVACVLAGTLTGVVIVTAAVLYPM